jgi:hypothetical protein
MANLTGFSKEGYGSKGAVFFNYDDEYKEGTPLRILP